MTETILIVDDEREIRKYAREALESLGYTVVDTGDPQHALRIVKERPVHLLLTDVVMPIMNGLELAKRVEAVSPATKVVLMSGDGRHRTVRAPVPTQTVLRQGPGRPGPRRVGAPVCVRATTSVGVGKNGVEGVRSWSLVDQGPATGVPAGGA